MQESDSLVLEILKLDNALKMSVFQQKELTSTLRHFSQSSVSFVEINKLCQEIISVLNKACKRGENEHDLIKDLRKTGQLLWEHLLTRQVKATLKSTQASDLILSLDEELIDIPWELLYDGINFLCLNFNLGRVVRTKEQVNTPEYRSPLPTTRMLILANPTSDLKSAYHEGVFIKNQLDHRRKEIAVNFKSTQIDTLYVKKNLRDYDIVHFAGHCEFDSENPKNSGWVFYDGRFTASDILIMGEDFSLPALVFSNACNCAKTTEGLVDSDYQQRSYSLASAFLFSGTRHYIGAIRKIEDPVSLIFAKEFYTQLISGRSVGECVRGGRLKLIKEYGIASIHWGSYLLYGDPNFVLFIGKVKPVKLKRKRDSSAYKKPLIYVSLSILLTSIFVYLYMWLPTKNPKTYILFLRSQKLFQKGNNEQVISNSNSIIQNDPLFLAAYPLVAETYLRLGDRKSALKNYFNYALYSEKRNDKKHLASAYIGIGWTYHLDGNYPKALDFYNKAVDLSKESGDRLNEAVGLRKLAVWYMDKEEDNKALELLTRSAEINRERTYLYAHRYNLACDYFNIGLLFTDKDDLITAKDFYQKSLKLFVALKLKHELSDCFFNLGEIHKLEKQYQNALDYYSKGLKIDESLNNAASISADYDMIGELYAEMGDWELAEKYFIRAITIAEEINATLEVASASFNLGLLYKQKGFKNKAREHFRQAQEIYSKVDTSDYQKVKQELLSLE
jgi:tetratricopeptide (TPR) repeat protein/CHAT domain-containing protein